MGEPVVQILLQHQLIQLQHQLTQLHLLIRLLIRLLTIGFLSLAATTLKVKMARVARVSLMVEGKSYKKASVHQVDSIVSVLARNPSLQPKKFQILGTLMSFPSHLCTKPGTWMMVMIFSWKLSLAMDHGLKLRDG